MSTVGQKRVMQAGAAAGVLALMLLGGCGGGHAEREAVELPEEPVRTGVIVKETQVRAQWLPGSAQPMNRTVLASQLMGTVAEADFVIGQRVAAGDALVLLSAEEVRAQLEQARAMVAEVERNFEREKALLAQNATAAENVRALEDALRIARARLEEARTMESYRTVRAPYAGTITAREVWRGDMAMPGRPLLTIEGEGPLQIYVQVPDSLSALDKGTMVEFEADGRLLTARLDEWSPAADPASRTRLAKLTVEDGLGVRSGQYVRVNWPAGQTESLLLPVAAVDKLGQIERIFVVEAGRARMRIVRTGPQIGDRVVIISGADAGETVILNAGKRLRDGQAVRVES